MEKAKAMLLPLTATTLGYYILLSLLLQIGEIGIGAIILLVAIPLICLLFSIAYGINHSFNILYAILSAVLFIPSMFIIGIMPMWIFVIMDGDYYNIVRGYENSESVFYGSNAYPLTYWFVYGVIHNAIE